jgi:hypothetical protein
LSCPRDFFSSQYSARARRRGPRREEVANIALTRPKQVFASPGPRTSGGTHHTDAAPDMRPESHDPGAIWGQTHFHKSGEPDFPSARTTDPRMMATNRDGRHYPGECAAPGHGHPRGRVTHVRNRACDLAAISPAFRYTRW